MEGLHPQFPSLPTLINGRVVKHVPSKNQFRESKTIPYVMPIYELGTPSWSSCEYSSTPSILSIEEEVIYMWEIDVLVSRTTDVQERRLARTKTIVRFKTPDEFMAKGYSKGNSHSTSGSYSMDVDEGVATTTSSTTGRKAVRLVPAH